MSVPDFQLAISMRSLFLLTLAAGALLLGGCASPLNVEKSGGSAASIIGVPSSQIRFMGYCNFGDALPGNKHIQMNTGQGLIVLTNDSLVLLAGDLPNANIDRKIKYKEIGGVDVRHFGRARQLQIIRGRTITVMEITKNKAMVDQEGTERAAEILRQHGVPAWKSERYYLPKSKIPIIIPIPI